MYEPTPVRITDLTLRDGHQSLLATRVRSEDLLALAPGLDELGLWSLEAWGGATFDVMTRFLNEDPWERLRMLKHAAPKTPLQMLLRGQNLVGYRNYADDVVRAFVRRAAENGVDVFRIFDALNDERNLLTTIEAVKESGKHVQAAVCYSLTQQKLGGPVYTVEYFVDKALTLQDMGADSICVKDMAGLLAPDDAYDLIFSLKAALDIPVVLHSHATSGMAPMSLLKAVEAGVDILDTCLAPFALRTSHTALETIIAALRETPRDTGLDLDRVLELSGVLETLAPKYRDYLVHIGFSTIDTAVLRHQIPGGMFSNMVAQLREANALERLPEVYAELPQTRKDLGYPPLVTPTSQIIGSQAVSNVLFGRYQAVSEQVKAYVYGMYGRPPAAVNPQVQAAILKGYEKGEKPISVRPGDIVEPELEAARRDLATMTSNEEDVLTYVLYPSSGMRFLRWKYGLEEPPHDTIAKTLDDVRHEDALCDQIRSGDAVIGETVREPAQNVDDVAKRQGEGLSQGTPLLSPMPGTIVRVLVAVGDEVQAGDGICVLEAMKMENVLPAPEEGRVVGVMCQPGDRVQMNQTLAVIG